MTPTTLAGCPAVEFVRESKAPILVRCDLVAAVEAYGQSVNDGPRSVLWLHSGHSTVVRGTPAEVAAALDLAIAEWETDERYDVHEAETDDHLPALSVKEDTA